MSFKIETIAFLVVCYLAGCTSPTPKNEEPWKATLRAELEHPQFGQPLRMDDPDPGTNVLGGGMCSFNTSTEVGKVLETVPRGELEGYLKSVRDLSPEAKIERANWLDLIITRVKPHGVPVQVKLENGTIMKAVKFSRPNIVIIEETYGSSRQQPKAQH